jgi:potassium-transporting ATPase KdpC subunit
MLRRQLFTGLKVTVALIVLTCGLYPVAVWVVGRVAFRHEASGSFVKAGGKVVGSRLIGQSFSGKDGNPLLNYFQPRPSAAGKGYDPTSSGGSNLGPSNPKLIDAVAQRVVAYRAFNGLAADVPVPVDAVTASGSGLDPDISVANAMAQVSRVATARHVSTATVSTLVRSHTNDRAWAILGEKTVNVLDLNLALDRLSPPG